MKSYRNWFLALVICAIIHFLIMLAIQKEGLDALRFLPLMLLEMLIGGIAIIIILIKGISSLSRSSESREQRNWEQKDTVLFIASISIVLFSVYITMALAR